MGGKDLGAVVEISVAVANSPYARRCGDRGEWHT